MSNIISNSNNIIKPKISIDFECLSEIKTILSHYSNVIIDMSDISKFSNSVLWTFYEYQKRITLVNTKSEILFLIYTMGYDKYINVFEDVISLIENKNELVNRRFVLL